MCFDYFLWKSSGDTDIHIPTNIYIFLTYLHKGNQGVLMYKGYIHMYIQGVSRL